MGEVRSIRLNDYCPPCNERGNRLCLDCLRSFCNAHIVGHRCWRVPLGEEMHWAIALYAALLWFPFSLFSGAEIAAGITAGVALVCAVGWWRVRRMWRG